MSNCAGYCTCGERFSRDSLSFDDDKGMFYCSICNKEHDIVSVVIELSDALCRAQDELIEQVPSTELLNRITEAEARVKKLSGRVDEVVMDLAGKLNAISVGGEE